ncbi:MAG: methyltransferase domain-containing protein [Deltaproteobacteria bacterium]|nr:methyltransferase domain-containing protein [Deltaproteobacteria bacterium]MCB9488002.1 methyltransferase domain-containing protein [Deltaproteobacteria bacterium]
MSDDDTTAGSGSVAALEKAWAEDPLMMDYLDPASPYFGLKRLSTDLYLRALADVLDAVESTDRVLDLGCGIGRFTVELAKRAGEVVAVDPCASSLAACRRHLAEAGLSERVRIEQADLSYLRDVPDGAFDLVLCAEVLNYSDDPEADMAEIVRVTQPSGCAIVSIEGRFGALVVRGVGEDQWGDALGSGRLANSSDGAIWLPTLDEFAALVQTPSGGRASVIGSHFLGEGVFWTSLDDERLGDDAYRRRIAQIDETLNADERVRPWARVFIAVLFKD